MILAQGRPIVIIPRQVFELLKRWHRPQDVRKVKK
jgi:hypothetical protein